VLESASSENLAERQAADPSALAKQSEVARELGITDPIFNEQWHLFNPVQLGHDVNVTDVWLQGITGHNATVAIVDDGLDMYSDDLKDNYYAEGSYDFNDQELEPKPRLPDDRHGTRCAGEVSAVKNNVCGVGVAYDSKIAGIRILSKSITDADEAIAMNYAFQHNQIYSCSWGPPDDGKSMDAPGILIKRAMVNGVQNGRKGKGSIYVFASGNGAANDDNCNFDGYTNSIYSITVGAVDRKGQHPYYSESCSANLVVTYSSGSGDAIVGPAAHTSSNRLIIETAHYRCWHKPVLFRTWRHISSCTSCGRHFCIGPFNPSRPVLERHAILDDADGSTY
jgi:kexin